MKATKAVAAISVISMGLGACSTPKAIYKDENFASKGPFEHHFGVSPEITFAAMKKVVLRQGYAVEKQSDKERAFVASKQRQKDNVNAVLTISAVSSNDGDNGTNGWMAVQEADFVVSETKQTSSVSALFFSIPIPTGSTRSVNKERGETILDHDFYENLFGAVEKEIPNSKKELVADKIESANAMRLEAEAKLRAEQQAKETLRKEVDAENARIKAAAESESNKEIPAKADNGAVIAQAPKAVNEELPLNVPEKTSTDLR